MKKFKRLAWAAVLALGLYGVVRAANTYRRETVSGTQIYLLQSDGTTTQTSSLKIGSDATAPAVPTTTTGVNFGLKLPVYNVGAAVVAGTILCSSNTGTAYVAACASDASKSVVGISEGAIASGALGYATVSGYALALTSATVSIGDVIVSSSTLATGYGAANNSPAAGSEIGVAISAGTSSGGLTLIKLK